MDADLLLRLRRQLARGEVVLFTGAGFSLAAQNVNKDPLPSSKQLKSVLWNIAFPGLPEEESSSLADVYEVAVQQAGHDVGTVLRSMLSVHPNTLPSSYELWFGFPWNRLYTLNIDDLDEAAQNRFSLPRRLQSVSALTGSFPDSSEDLLSIHLNGCVSDYPNVTFSDRQYGERSARGDPWYSHLIADVMSKPVLFIGTQLDEPPLWHYLDLRRKKGSSGRELRPGSYLVTPSIPMARRAVLSGLNIAWIQADQATFATDVLLNLTAEREGGHLVLGRQSSRRTSTTALARVGELRVGSTSDPRDYLMGRQATWADITDGFAVTRAFEENLIDEIEAASPRVVAILGTAGAGKSTSLLRMALQYHAKGLDVRWVDLDGNLNRSDFPRAVKESGADVLVMDNADIFGRTTASLLSAIVGRAPNVLILAAMRSPRYERLGIRDGLGDISLMEVSIPHLEDTDIESLIDALTRANRLGALKGKGPAEQIQIFREKARRQLLVAMIEATSGEAFEVKIDSECRDLPMPQALLYAIVAVASSMQFHMARDEIMMAAGQPNNETLNDVQSLLNQHLLIEILPGQRIFVRHHVIAEHVVEYFRREGQLRDALAGIIFAMASKVPIGQRRSREGRLLIRLLNHEWLRHLVAVTEARQIYAEIENLLTGDYHFWLQRGSLELEVGDLSLAENFLNQARGLAPEDYKVQTAWAYLLLKKAARDGRSPQAHESARIAFEELQAAINSRGARDPYPYHVLGSQGLTWIRHADLSFDERKALLEKLRTLVNEGLAIHGRAELNQLAGDLEREYLMMAVASRDTSQATFVEQGSDPTVVRHTDVGTGSPGDGAAEGGA